MPVVIPQSWSGSLISTRNQLVHKVAAKFGFDTANDTDLAARALEWLDDAVKDLNTNTWECSKGGESGILLTEGQQYVVLSQQFYKASQAYLVHNTDGDKVPLKSLPWVNFKRMYWSNNKNGCPSIYTFYNPERDSRLYFDTLPDADTVSNYTLAVEAYTRFQKISEVAVNNAPDIPEEFENVILYGALKRGASHFDSRRVGEFASLEAEALERCKRIDSMLPDADRRFRLIDEVIGSAPPDDGIYPFF